MQMLHGTMKLTEKERDANVTLLSEYKYVIALGEDDLDQMDIVQHSIDTGSSEPVRQHCHFIRSRLYVSYWIACCCRTSLSLAMTFNLSQELMTHWMPAHYFSMLDLASEYWQVAVNPADREKTAFMTPYGLYQFKIICPSYLSKFDRTCGNWSPLGHMHAWFIVTI